MNDSLKISLILGLIEQYWDICVDADSASMQLISDVELIARYESPDSCVCCGCKEV